MATRSSTVKPSADSGKTVGSVNLARLIRRSSAETGLQDLSSNGIYVIILYFCSKRICSTVIPERRKTTSSLHDKADTEHIRQ